MCVAEVLKHFFPKLVRGAARGPCATADTRAQVDMNNYQPASNSDAKKKNWQTLNKKVLAKIDIAVPATVIAGIVSARVARGAADGGGAPTPDNAGELQAGDARADAEQPAAED